MNNSVWLQLIRTEEGETVITTAEDESKKRRDVLTRRPSYRKILNDLSSAESVSGVQLSNSIKQEDQDHLERGDTGPATITVTSPYLKVLPAVVAGSQDGSLQGSLQTLAMANATGAGTSAIVQYATQGQDGQFFVPGKYFVKSKCELSSNFYFVQLLCRQPICRQPTRFEQVGTQLESRKVL